MSAVAPVLVVDDDDDLRVLLQTALEAEGYPVVTAANGSEVLAYLRHKPPPSLVLLDLMMPVCDGWTVLRTLHDEPDLAPNVPIVIVSASGHAPVEKAKLLRPAADVLHKPVDLDRLLELVKRLAAP